MAFYSENPTFEVPKEDICREHAFPIRDIIRDLKQRKEILDIEANADDKHLSSVW